MQTPAEITSRAQKIGRGRRAVSRSHQPVTNDYLTECGGQSFEQLKYARHPGFKPAATLLQSVPSFQSRGQPTQRLRSLQTKKNRPSGTLTSGRLPRQISELLLAYSGADHYPPAIHTNKNDAIGIHHIGPEIERRRWRLRSSQMHRIPLRPAQRPISLQSQQPIYRNACENLAVTQFGEIHYSARDVVRARARYWNHANKILFKSVGQIHATPIDRVPPSHRSRRECPALRRDGPIRNHIGGIVLNKPLRRRGHIKNILKSLIPGHVREVQRPASGPRCINRQSDVAESAALRESIYPAAEILIHVQDRHDHV